MQAFISYSTADLDVVQKIKKAIDPLCEVRYWDKDKSLGKEAWATIFHWIDSSDLVLAIVTGSTVSRAMAIGQEIGRAKAKGKLIIPLIAEDIPKTELGCLNSVTYEPFSRKNIDNAVQSVKRSVEELKLKKDQQVALLLLGLIIGLIFLSSE